MGKLKCKKFFPEKVYRCDCLAPVIGFCLVNEIYSLMDICKKVNQTIRKTIYCVKCGENQQNAIFSCGDQTTISFHDETKTYCSICVKKYLQKMYYIFEHVNFKLKN